MTAHNLLQPEKSRQQDAKQHVLHQLFHISRPVTVVSVALLAATAVIGSTINTMSYLDSISTALPTPAIHSVDARRSASTQSFALLDSSTSGNSAGQVLGASIRAPVPSSEPQINAADVTATIASQVSNQINQDISRGLLTGPAGPQGPQGLAGASGIVQNGNGQTTAVINENPIVTYVPSNPATDFTGGSIAGFTDLSSGNLSTQTANIQGALTVSGSASIAGSASVGGTFTAGTSTISSLTVSGPVNLTGSTTIAGLNVTGFNPGLIQGSIAFQGASGLSQDNANFFYNAASHQLGLGTTTPSQLLSVAGNMQLSGALFDSTNASGTLGMILQATGSGTKWVATSTLGIGGGGVSGGTTGYDALFTSPTAVSEGIVIDNGVVAGINASSSTVSFNIQGSGSLNPFNVASSSGSSLFTVLANGNVGIGTTVFNSSGGNGSAPDLTIGSDTPSGILYSIGEQRQVSGASLYFDAIHDENIVNVGGGGYASFDSDATINGSTAMNHTAAFQDRMIYNNVGGIGQINGFVEEPVINAQATSTTGFQAYDITGTGSVANYTAFQCDSFTFAASSYCIYSAGSSPSYFGGNIQSGGTIQGVTLKTTGLEGTYGQLVSTAADGTLIANPNLSIVNGVLQFGSATSIINFGGTTSSFPAIKRNGASLNFLLADSSGNAAITAGAATFSGNVGIGTTTASGALVVQGTSTASTINPFVVASSTGTQLLTVSPAGGLTASDYPNCSGFTTNSSGLIQCTASDERLKQEITPLGSESGLAAINALNPVSFYWLDPTRGTTEQFGFIAQQVQQIFPNLVSTTTPTALTPGGTLTLNYDGLISPLILATQELSGSSTAMQSAISALQNQVSNLQNSFGGNASSSSLTVYSPSDFSGDSVGEAEIPSGQTSVHVSFSQPYAFQPIVTFSPEGEFVPAFIAEKDSAGFTLDLEAATTNAVTFDWHSFASPNEQLTVTGGTPQPITLIVARSAPASDQQLTVSADSDSSSTTTPAESDSSATGTPDVVGTSTPASDQDSGNSTTTASTVSSSTPPMATPTPTVVPTPTPTVSPTPTAPPVQSPSPLPTPAPTAPPADAGTSSDQGSDPSS